MKYVIDHDYHIHTVLSKDVGDALQNPENVLKYAKKNGLKKVIVTEHYWDKAVDSKSRGEFYEPLDYNQISKSLPLPKADGIDFLFGCETDMDKENVIGIPKERYNDFAFIIIPTTHLHMHAKDIDNYDPDYRAGLWVERFESILGADLPFYKVGIPHLSCGLLNRQSRELWGKTLDAIPISDMERLFTKAKNLGVGIEINCDSVKEIGDDIKYYKMYKIAKECGCKFYLGSDAHSRIGLANAKAWFTKAIDYLGLEESDKFYIKED